MAISERQGLTQHLVLLHRSRPGHGERDGQTQEGGTERKDREEGEREDGRGRRPGKGFILPNRREV